MSRSVHVPAGIFDGLPYGFAQVAMVPTPFGNAVHVSGQVAWDADQNIVGAGDISRQLEKSLENLAVALESVGAKAWPVMNFSSRWNPRWFSSREGPDLVLED